MDEIKVVVCDESSNTIRGASVSLRVVWPKGRTKYYDCHTSETGEMSLEIPGGAVSIVARVTNEHYYASGYVFDISEGKDHLIAKIELRYIKMPSRIRNQVLKLQFSENHKIEKINFIENSGLNSSVFNESWAACAISKRFDAPNSVILTLHGNNMGFSQIDWPAETQYSDFRGPYQVPKFGYIGTATIELHDLSLGENEDKRVFESNGSYYAIRAEPKGLGGVLLIFS
jgi:hypothetical protein